MTLHGYEILGEWKNSQCGQTAKASKGDKKYFLKKYQTPVKPLDNGTLDEKTFNHNKEVFNEFVSERRRINETLRTISGPGGNIIIPCEEFIEGNHYMEAAELVEGAIEYDELDMVLRSLSIDVKKLLMQTAAGALSGIHSKHIIHSDLKLKNVLLVRNTAGNYVAKLIDFDSSFFVERKPDEIVGTIDYYSPELGAYADAEDERDDLGKYVTEKSDIFSLGLIFHYYLSGALPIPISLTEKLRKRKEKGKAIYCWVALNSGCKLQISSKIKNPRYISLISDMLSMDPIDRPSASNVLRRLKEIDSGIKEPCSDHRVVRKEELIRDKLVKNYVPLDFCKPWDEHNILFDIDRIKSRGFISSEQKIIHGLKGYNFYRTDSSSIFLKLDMLIAMKYANKKPSIIKDKENISEPWPEHKIELIKSNIIDKGFIRVEQDIMGGVKGYKFIRNDGSFQFMRREVVLIQKMGKMV